MHYLRLYLYSSILYTILHYIPILPYCTLSYILSLLFHTVNYHALYPYSSKLYNILHSISTLPHCTLSYIISLLFHTVHYLHSIPTPYCTLSYILSLLFHNVHYLTFYLYSSIMYTFLYYISTLLCCTLSYMLSCNQYICCTNMLYE